MLFSIENPLKQQKQNKKIRLKEEVKGDPRKQRIQAQQLCKKLEEGANKSIYG